MGVIGVGFSAKMCALVARMGMGVKSLRTYLSEPRPGEGGMRAKMGFIWEGEGSRCRML